jgi:hypothetical protein
MSEQIKIDENHSKEKIDYTKFAHAEHIEAMKAIREFSLQGIRMIYILNGGAIIALMTFIGNTFSNNDEPNIIIKSLYMYYILSAFPFFAGGLLFGGILSIIAYINYSLLQQVYPSSGDLMGWLRGENIAFPKIANKWANLTAIIGLVVAILSLICFGLGCYYVYAAFKYLSN